ncbi:MAG: hypothetical protein M3R04_02060 [bacterium]|nr:hypothetical protein [bacterium]
MRLLLTVFFLAIVAGCSGNAKPPALATQRFAIPEPGELSRLSPRQASGSYAALNRTLVQPGDAFVTFPGFSKNAELGASGNAILHGTTTDLSFVMYQLNSTVVGDQQQIAQISADVTWPTAAPAEPNGVYIGLPDHAADNWNWIDAREVEGKWLDVTAMNLHGLDPAIGVPSYIAFVNFSAQDAHLSQIRLRFETAATNFGDEYIYYTSRDAAAGPMATSVSRYSIGSFVSETLFEADAAASYIAPVIASYNSDWTLFYSQRPTGLPAEIYFASVDGTGSAQAWNEVAAELFPGHWNYGDDHALYLRYDGLTTELWAEDTDPGSFATGRLSRAIDNVGGATWDISVDTTSLEFAAIATIEVDALAQQYSLVRFAGNRPFNIDATPMLLYTALTGEDARDPAMVELSDFAGNPQPWVYFASRNRDDSTYNLYRVNREAPGSDPEPVIVDAAYDLRYPAMTPNGRYLTYVRFPPGSGFSDNGELMIADLLNPYGASSVANDAVGFTSWYDPTE